MQVSLEGRVALVTGGGRGIGRAISLALAEAGADVAINYRRDAEAANEVAREIRKMGRRAEPVQACVENWDDDVAMVEKIVRDFGSLGIVVNNAGIASRGNFVADTDPKEVERVMSVHAFGPFYLAKLAIPHMRRQPRGDIVMISSTGVRKLEARNSPYTMAKSAMETLAVTLAKEERQHGIRAHIVAPSLTVTDMGRRLAKAKSGAEDIHELDASSPFGRVSEPEDVALAVTWLVSSANPYASGQKINIDGGG